MGDQKLSPNFSLKEFRCTCCGEGIPSVELIEKVLEPIRFVLSNRYGRVKITISGPLRCEKRNAETPGASKDSRHLFKYSDGVDIKAFSYIGPEEKGYWRQINPDEVASVFEYLHPNKYGLGMYQGRTHVDSRPGKKARWDFR